MKLINRQIIFVAIGIIALAVLGSGGYYWYRQSQDDTLSSSSNALPTATVDTTDEAIDWDILPTTTITLSNETLTISEAGTYVLNGSTDAGVVITSDSNVRLVLNDATITNKNGAAIVAEGAEYVVIQTQSGTTNTVNDASTRENTDIDGAIYVQNNLTITGDGTLHITANYADGIVAKDALKITSSTVNVTSIDDGIRGRDTTTITGGTITVNAKGDGIKASNDEDATKGNLFITGGTITVTSGDDAIKAEEKLIVDDGIITIKSSVEGIEAATITINGGTIDIYATDDGINASESNFTTAVSITINGGDLTVEVGPGDTDAIDSNGDITIAGGTIRLTGQVSTIDYDGTATKTGGTLILNGIETDQIPAGMMGGPGGQGGRR